MASKRVKYFALPGILLVAVLIYFFLPSNYYLRQAALHQHPGIDDVEVFSTRSVQALHPQVWTFADEYNQASLPEELLSYFDSLQTIAFLVIQHNQIVFEKYWGNYSEKSYTNSFSMAKSIVGLLVACAIDDGYIQSVEQPVSDFIPNYPESEWGTLRIRHLLDMAAGVDYEESYSTPFSTTAQFFYGNNLDELTLSMKQISRPGEVFKYQSGVTQLLAYVLCQATQQHLAEYASKKLWTPLGAERDALWSLDKKDGREKAYCCFYSNARDFARLGQLILQGGQWNDSTLISPEQVYRIQHPDTTLHYKKVGRPNYYYSSQWWTIPREAGNIYYAKGLQGQYVFAIPELDAVVVRLGHLLSNERDEMDNATDISVWLTAGYALLGQEY